MLDVWSPMDTQSSPVDQNKSLLIDKIKKNIGKVGMLRKKTEKLLITGAYNGVGDNHIVRG